jgi:hypothetical protein
MADIFYFAPVTDGQVCRPFCRQNGVSGAEVLTLLSPSKHMYGLVEALGQVQD